MREDRSKRGLQSTGFGPSRWWAAWAAWTAVLSASPMAGAITVGNVIIEETTSLTEDHIGQIELRNGASLFCNGHSIISSAGFVPLENCEDDTGTARSCGLKVLGGSGATIHDCRIGSAGRWNYGLWVKDASDLQIILVDAGGTYGAGLHVADSVNFRVEDSNFSQNWGHGVELIRASSASIVDTAVLENREIGFYQEDSDWIQYFGGEATGNWGGGLYVLGGENNVVENFEATGGWVGVEFKDTYTFTIEGTVTTSNDYGIRVANGRNGHILGNVAHGNSVYDAWQSYNSSSPTNSWHDNDFETRRNVPAQ
ncbi:right-handed parallel beta-helix repeat-containing protein [Sorangium sp. So ce426]|uniref:right-handed parallel beta-helix repeat-containing protein n=1 Tax=unclassified Sorangium TaxID=2621164 RepID=UPI003F5BEB56